MLEDIPLNDRDNNSCVILSLLSAEEHYVSSFC